MTGPTRLTVSEALNLASNGRYQLAAGGAINTSVTVTPTGGNKEIKQIIISASSAAVTATLDIYKDSATVANRIFTGYVQNLDGDSSVRFPEGITATVIITSILGGTGNYYTLVRHN